MNKEFSWFKLLNVTNLGAKGINNIIQTLQKEKLDIESIFTMELEEFENTFPFIGKGRFTKLNYNNFRELDFDSIESSYQKYKENKITLIPITDERYPQNIKAQLKENAPPILFCKGYLGLLNASRNISIVGSRDADNSCLKFTNNLAKELSNNAYNVVSGYAKGVDSSAHIGSLEAEGTTTVVLSMGLNHLIVKNDFKKLNWENNTLFISQFLPFEQWTSRNAMLRNSVVCSYSEAVVVILSGPEKDSKGRMSGTFNAGKIALNLNIPLFVLSPEILNIPAIGNKELIKLGGIEFKENSELINYLERNKNSPKETKEQLSIHFN